MSSPNSVEPGKSQPQQKLPIWFLWLLIMGMLLAWNFSGSWQRSQPLVHLPYTAFLDQVKRDNVSEVTINGEEIHGNFKRSILWPEPATPVTAPKPAAGNRNEIKTGKPETDGASPPPRTYRQFQTIFPEPIGDASLMPLLEAHRVVVNVEPPASHWLLSLLIDALPLLLLVLYFLWMGRRAFRSQASIFSFGRTRARRLGGDQPKVTFRDAAGVDEAKGELKEVVDFLSNPRKYHEIGARIPRGVLLVGPPGTGKTLLARAVAGEANVPFFSLSASEFVEMFVGVGASRVRDLFVQAKTAAPSIMFIDELDAVGRRRGAGIGTVNDEREQTLNQLLVEMDGFDARHEVIVLAATNRPDVLDPALLRPGRFDRQVMVGLPDQKGREGILKIHVRNIPLSPSVDLSVIARTTTVMSGADLANLCNEAALIAARGNRAMVSMADFEEAVDKLLLGQIRPLLLDPQERLAVACHEAGHALIAWLTPSADPVHKVTIIPRGRALGVTEQLPDGDRYNYDRSYLMARLAVMLGGRTAEEVSLGEISTGAENDLVQATRLARHMIARWGMGSIGLAAYQADEEHPFLGYQISQARDYSEATAARIDQDIQELLEERHKTVRKILTEAHDKLDSLTEALFEKETIGEEELTAILGPRPTVSRPREISGNGAGRRGSAGMAAHGMEGPVSQGQLGPSIPTTAR